MRYVIFSFFAVLSGCASNGSPQFNLVNLNATSDCKVLYSSDRPYEIIDKEGKRIRWGVGNCTYDNGEFLIWRAQSIDVTNADVARIVTQPNKNKNDEVSRAIIRKNNDWRRAGSYTTFWSKL